MKWQEPPDFRWFVGDEPPTFDSRASNELMYIRGVGNLHPEPRDSYGPYSTYNDDLVDSILISAVRSAYEGLIKRLKHHFEVDVLDAFDFVVRKEEVTNGSYDLPIKRVVAWSLEEADKIQARRDKEAADEQDQRDRSKLANLRTIYGFTVETLVSALLDASATKSTGPAPSLEHLNRNTAKKLRSDGFKVDAGDIRQLRKLIEHYRPETLPEALRTQTSSVAQIPNNIVPFRTSET